ncbi:MAG TPA: cation-transporting P-type ATPase [Dermatophilaceae bacterium]|nr:cation-transporting P-type ATPase [Dermatophilaceae bacterium]
MATVPGAGVAMARRGLTAEEVSLRLQRDGPNQVPRQRPPSPWSQLAAQFVHFFAVMLWVAAGLALLARMPQLSVAIAVVVVLNGVFAFVQEYRADRAAARLVDLLPAQARVLRDGRVQDISADELVVDDLILFESGDRVSADVRIDDVQALAVDESLLTGESVAARPGIGALVHAGTFVVEGAARGTVVATGGKTRLAAIAALTRSAKPPRSPLSVQLHRIVTTVAIMAVATGLVAYAVSVLLGLEPSDGFLFAVGVTVALVPEGLLPTVTLSLARAAQLMATRRALVRRLESVETLGSTTFICTDKTGTLTRNEMNVVTVWTPAGTTTVEGVGYDPTGRVVGPAEAVAATGALARSAALCVHGTTVLDQGRWRPKGDPMEVALEVLARRCGMSDTGAGGHLAERFFPFDPVLRRSAARLGGQLHVLGAPDGVLPLCTNTGGAVDALDRMSHAGLRVLAVARRDVREDEVLLVQKDFEHGLELLGLLGLEDPPRAGVDGAIATCRRAGIRVAMVTGDHPGTARAIATEVGLLGEPALVLEGADLPAADRDLAELIDRDGVVIARATPEHKLRIAQALQQRGHVVAMTGDGVNDGPALHKADIGVAMGASGTDVAREASDLVLLDDRFETIVTAVELGRSTFSNVRRFLTYHLTDNVAELTPFVVWSLSAGRIPLALSVLQVLALDIGTDLLPALALGAEPANRRVLDGPLRTRQLLDGRLLRRVFGVLGPTEAVVEMGAFLAVLAIGGWRLGHGASTSLLALASGAAFAAVVLGQMANAFACRSETRWFTAVPWRSNPLLLWAVGIEVALLLVMLGWPALAGLLGGSLPTATGWALAAAAVPAVLVADGVHKSVARRRRSRG